MSTDEKDPAREGALVEVETVAGEVLRRDGWTRARQGAFLRALASTHSVSAAARAAGKSRQSAYKLRARLKGQPFDLAWDAAFQSAFDRLAEAAMDRALNGVEVPHFHKGELVGTSRRYDERLTIALFRLRESFLRAPGPARCESAAYEPEDFRGLLERVEKGTATWEDEFAKDEAEGWDSLDCEE
ncbi:hypothetical protein GCM10011371_19140 [Novosphingobium marinum]|uniref:Uncharacterized protein n=1 Tax=Novosphingobium marinum TaxID=1514948 RepID=A0A7Y9XWQ9_9SPHN|nr:hypothetical protein [Novosphingobium marinum]NYH96026.1 hypothetical protein [Novosphingobium marinum]GGC31850.1 hypothetical protein GCM10011371_19140 [Novosphingobium marinum]